MRRVLEIDVYWKTRHETEAECAARAVRFLRGLGEIDASLASWGWTDYDHGAAFHRLPLTLDALEERFIAGRMRDDDDGRIEDLGYSIELSDRFHNDRIRMTINSGIFAPRIANSVGFEIGSWSERASVAMLVAMLDCTMESWGGEQGSVSVRGLGELFPYVTGSMAMGSCMRLPAPPRDLPPLPAGVRVEPRGERGSLVVLTEERFDLDNPAHVALARGAHAALSEAGLLRIWPPR